MSREEYIEQFKELMIRCDVIDDYRFTIMRFCFELRPKIKRGMIPYPVDSLGQAYS